MRPSFSHSLVLAVAVALLASGCTSSPAPRTDTPASVPPATVAGTSPTVAPEPPTAPPTAVPTAGLATAAAAPAGTTQGVAASARPPYVLGRADAPVTIEEWGDFQ